MEELGWHYPYGKGRMIYGYSMVSSQYRAGSISFPYNFQFYKSEKEALKNNVEFKSKQDITKDFIRDFKQFFDEKIYILDHLDSWYTSKEVIEVVKGRGFDIIGGIKSNRVFKLQKDGQKHKVLNYVKNLANTSFEKIILGDIAYLIKRMECYLPGVGKAVILSSQRERMTDRNALFLVQI